MGVSNGTPCTVPRSLSLMRFQIFEFSELFLLDMKMPSPARL
jgi:hypothetical protein